VDFVFSFGTLNTNEFLPKADPPLADKSLPDTVNIGNTWGFYLHPNGEFITFLPDFPAQTERLKRGKGVR
jgi:hypothetical protein